jgi:hypothetical protein
MYILFDNVIELLLVLLLFSLFVRLILLTNFYCY